MKSTNKDKICEYINFTSLHEKYADATTPPAFDASTATHKEKVAQWMFYFTKHAEEVTEVLKGTEDVLCAHLTWVFEHLPAFAAAMVSDDLTAGSYISIGNKTLRTLCIDGHEPQDKAHIRFSDGKALDAIAKEVRAAEITPMKHKKGRMRKEEKEIIIHTSKIEDNGILYEEIHNNGAVAFIDGNGLTYEHLDVGGIAHEPISGDELTEGAVLLASDIEDYGNEKTLIEEIKAHIHRYVDVSPFFETISAYYTLLTWLYDEVNTLPYLRALGDTGCGKSRYEDVVGRICYKATIVSGAITPAPIYRLIRKWRGTLIIDEGDFKASDEQNEVVKILNCGFERGRPVVRSQKDNPDNLQFLPTFSPKILSSRKRFKDVALESRCLTEIMKETDRVDLPYLLPSEFYEEEVHLRNKLLSFRFKNHGKVDLQKAQKLKTVKVEDRLKQAVSSFIVLFANNDEIYNEFIKFLTAYNTDLVEERLNTYEGGIINAIYGLLLIKTSTVTVTNVIHVTNVTEEQTTITPIKKVESLNRELSEVEITATDINAVLTDHLSYKAEFTSTRSIGKRLRVLGITTKRVKSKETGKTRAILILEARHLSKLFKKYLPESVMLDYDSYDVYVTWGERGKRNPTGEEGEDKIKSCSPIEKGKCERCGEERFLDHKWEDGEHKRLICSKCASELKEVVSND